MSHNLFLNFYMSISETGETLFSCLLCLMAKRRRCKHRVAHKVRSPSWPNECVLVGGGYFGLYEVTAGPGMVHLIQNSQGPYLPGTQIIHALQKNPLPVSSQHTPIHTLWIWICKSAIHQVNRWLTKAIYLLCQVTKFK